MAHTADAPPPLPPVEEDDCYGPATGIYAPLPKQSTEVTEAAQHYLFMNYTYLRQLWLQHMPRSASDPWLKSQVVLVRFAIMPDGSIDTPVVTLTSGRKNYDQHALDTVLKAAPFAPLPAVIKRPLPVCMRFAYDTNPEQERKKNPKASPY